MRPAPVSGIEAPAAPKERDFTVETTSTNTPDLKTSPIDTLPLAQVATRIMELIRPLDPEQSAELDLLIERRGQLREQFGFCLSCGRELNR
jgi:hypothetical protein